MDGNNRWSKKNMKKNYYSYKKGAQKLIEITNHVFNNYTINYISAFALSKNNLNRSNKILNNIIDVLDEILDFSILQNNNYQIRFIGDLSILSEKINYKIDRIQNLNLSSNKKLIIFFNYGGQEEILEMAKKISLLKNFSKNNCLDNLESKGIPSPEILIRTGGFQRLSNFMLFQIAFTELFFLKKLWPDIRKHDVDKIIEKYFKIERKFGF
jgi:undecaprenyl diphosphate synthase